MDDKDIFHEVTIVTEEFELQLGVYESELRKAGYTIEDVRDINSLIGVQNLMDDLEEVEE